MAGNYSYGFSSATDAPYSSLGGFFPLDGKGFGNEGLDSNLKSHNFAFTTELRFWFTYDAGSSPQLAFSGDDADEGGANTNSGAYGSCRLDCKLGPYCGDKLVKNPPEQCDDGTNLTSWTAAFSATACAPLCLAPSYCGDALVQGTFGEKCDNGTAQNTGAYGTCTATCQPGPRCGDGLVQTAAGESCDNGSNLTDYVKHPTATDCAPSCLKPRSCGDGVRDVPFEQCDNGAANTSAGTYNSCSTECTLGPRCGDGVTSGPEECDDGNRTNGDGCSAACLKEGPK